MLVSITQHAPTPPPAESYDYFVSTTGNDGNPGTIGSPFATIDHAINVAAAALTGTGKVIGVRGGTYSQMNDSSTGSGTSNTNRILVKNYNGEYVLMKPPAASPFIIRLGKTTSQSYIVFDGINEDGTDIDYFMNKLEVVAGVGEAHHITFQNADWLMGRAYVGILNSGDFVGPQGSNIVRNITIHGPNVQNLTDSNLAALPNEAFYIGTSNNLIEGCNISGILGGGGQLTNSYGQIQDSNIIRNNYWHDIVDVQANDPFARIWAFIVFAVGTDNRFYNNVMARIGTGGSLHYGLAVGGGAVDTKVWFNTAYHVLGTSYDCDQDTTTSGSARELRDNISYDSTVDSAHTSGYTVSNNLFSVDPSFVNAGASDFHLQGGSAAKGAGITVSAVPTDKDGVTRANPPSIGAYE